MPTKDLCPCCARVAALGRTRSEPICIAALEGLTEPSRKGPRRVLSKRSIWALSAYRAWGDVSARSLLRIHGVGRKLVQEIAKVHPLQAYQDGDDRSPQARLGTIKASLLNVVATIDAMRRGQ